MHAYIDAGFLGEALVSGKIEEDFPQKTGFYAGQITMQPL
jgi:hypothetical protein